MRAFEKRRNGERSWISGAMIAAIATIELIVLGEGGEGGEGRRKGGVEGEAEGAER